MNEAAPRICLHHIGGRSGTTPLPLLPRFARDLVSVLYDADEACAAQMSTGGVLHGGGDVHVLPYCLADTARAVDFNINYDPYTSSVLDLNSRYAGFCEFQNGHDYVYAEAIRSMERRRLEAVPLDDVLEASSQVPTPDFLSVDAEGFEYEVLEGAQKALADSVLVVVVEVEFSPIFVGQKLFGDVARLLASAGFQFARFLRVLEASPVRVPIGLRGDGMHVQGDALFVKDLDRVGASASVGSEDARSARYLGLRKLAFLSVVFGQVEYALQCLRSSRLVTPDRDGVDRLAETTFGRFLLDFEKETERMLPSWPPTFAAVYDFADSQRRFEDASLTRLRKLRASLRNMPQARAFARSVRTGIETVASAARSGGTRDTGVERLFKRYGLRDQARLLRQRRLDQRKYGRVQAAHHAG